MMIADVQVKSGVAVRPRFCAFVRCPSAIPGTMNT